MASAGDGSTVVYVLSVVAPIVCWDLVLGVVMGATMASKFLSLKRTFQAKILRP